MVDVGIVLIIIIEGDDDDDDDDDDDNNNVAHFLNQNSNARALHDRYKSEN